MQMKEFGEILIAIGNQIFKLDPKMMGAVLRVFPNRFAREASQYIIENGERLQQQQQAMQKAEMDHENRKQDRREKVEFAKMTTPKVTYKMSPQDLAESPLGAKTLFMAMNEAAQKLEKEPEVPEEQLQQGAEQNVNMEGKPLEMAGQGV
jgi:hypothetical protein